MVQSSWALKLVVIKVAKNAKSKILIFITLF